MLHGFTMKGEVRIPHRIIQAMRQAGFNGIQHDLLDTILDQTIGWNKKEDLIAIDQFAELTRKKPSEVYRNLKELEVRKVIIVRHTGSGRGKVNAYSVNGNVEEWLGKDEVKRLPRSKRKTVRTQSYRVGKRLEKAPLKDWKSGREKTVNSQYTITDNNNNSKSSGAFAPEPSSGQQGRPSPHPAEKDFVPAIGREQAHAAPADQTVGHGTLNPMDEKKRKAGIEEFFGTRGADFIMDPRYAGMEVELLLDQAELDALGDPAVTPSNVREFVRSILERVLCERAVMSP